MDHHSTIAAQKGASLVEICITVVVISMTTLIILSFMRSTTSMSKDARGSDAAYLSAEGKIVELSKMPFPQSGRDMDTIDNTVMNRSWSVKDTNNFTRVLVTVSYTSLQGSSRSIILAGAAN